MSYNIQIKILKDFKGEGKKKQRQITIKSIVRQMFAK